MKKGVFYKEKFSKSEFIRKYNKTDLTNLKTRQIMEMSDDFLDKINSGYNFKLEYESEQHPYNSKETERFKRLVKRDLKDFRNKDCVKLLYKLLTLSKNKTPQHINIHSKDMNSEYSSNHYDDGIHPYRYCKKSNISFFKWKWKEVVEINNLGYSKLFSQCFVYGYIFFFIELLFKTGDDYFFPMPKEISKIYEKTLYMNLFTKIFNLNKHEAKNAIKNLEDSYFYSNLSKFLFLKEERYFFGRNRTPDSFYRKNNSDGFGNTFAFTISDLFRRSEINNKKIYKFKDSKDKKILSRFKELHNSKHKSPIYENFYDYYIMFDFDIIKFMTLMCPMSTPFNQNELQIEDKDIFIRYATNMGFYEASYYLFRKLGLSYFSM